MKFVTKNDRLRFEVFAKPRAKKSQIVGEREDALVVAIAAPPVDGAANEELLRTLAKALGVPPRDLTLVRGDGSRTKLVEVTGVTEAEARTRFFG